MTRARDILRLLPSVLGPELRWFVPWQAGILLLGVSILLLVG